MAPGVGMYFGVVETLQLLLDTAQLKSSGSFFWQNMFIGMAARTVPAATLMPVTVLKSRFEVSYSM